MAKAKKKVGEQAAMWVPGVKGFNKDLTCRGYQFKEGETFSHDGTVKACDSGFHYCGNPLDVFGYYAPGESAFHQVIGGGQFDLEHKDDSKIACSEIHIGASISLHDLIGGGLKFFFSRKYVETTSQHATGYSSASSATGYRSASSATGDRSASSATGYSSSAVCTGLAGKAMAGKYGCIALAWWNQKEKRREMRCAETGCGDGSDGKLKAEVWYSLNELGEFSGITV